MTIFRVPVTIDYPADGGPGRNVWHVRTVGPSGADDTAQLGEALDALEAFYNALRFMYPSGTDIVLGEGMIRDPLGNPTYQNDDRRLVTGNNISGSAPTLLAIVCGWRTSSATRSGRGRTFIGPLALDNIQPNGSVVDAELQRVQSAATGLVQASTGLGGWAVGVLSVKQGVLRDITGVTIRDRFAYLSSRRD